MPCGGIYPIYSREATKCNSKCFQCNKLCKLGENISFVEEWDSFIHDECINEFLRTSEGKIILEHEHKIIRRSNISEIKT